MSLLLLNETMAMVSARDYDLSHLTDESYFYTQEFRGIVVLTSFAFIVIKGSAWFLKLSFLFERKLILQPTDKEQELVEKNRIFYRFTKNTEKHFSLKK